MWTQSTQQPRSRRPLLEVGDRVVVVVVMHHDDTHSCRCCEYAARSLINTLPKSLTTTFECATRFLVPTGIPI